MHLDVSPAKHEIETRTNPRKMVLRFDSVSKRFGSVIANDHISFEIESGGIHAIVGENGAGKSTLSKILYGYYRPDSGAIHLNDTELKLKSPSEARRAGIGMVHQQLALVPSLTGLENVLLGDSKAPFLFRRDELARRVTLRARELGFGFDLSLPVADLSIAERQKLEIFKLLWRDARVLVLDEPTSQLTPFEANGILSLVDELARSGRIIILITHHISEVTRFASAVTVLRKGKCITTIDTASTNSDDLAKLMVDADLVVPRKLIAPGADCSLVNLESVSTRASRKERALSGINLELHQGEVVGVAGISGSGQNELGRLVAGLIQPSEGSLVLRPEEESPNKVPHAREVVSYIPSEQGLASAPGLSITANSFMKSVNDPRAQFFGFIKSTFMRRQAKSIIDWFQLTPDCPDFPAGVLSGGNLQRLIIGRELVQQSRVVVADNPCAGLDASVSLRVRQELRSVAMQGRAVLLISPDLEELIETCDRIIVLFNGRINGQQHAADFDYQSLALMMSGKMQGNLESSGEGRLQAAEVEA